MFNPDLLDPRNDEIPFVLSRQELKSYSSDLLREINYNEFQRLMREPESALLNRMLTSFLRNFRESPSSNPPWSFLRHFDLNTALSFFRNQPSDIVELESPTNSPFIKGRHSDLLSSQSISEFIENFALVSQKLTLWKDKSHIALEGAERFLTTRLYRELLTRVERMHNQDHILENRCLKFRHIITPQQLDINPYITQTRGWAMAIQFLEAMNSFRSPKEKFSCAINACKALSQALTELEDDFNLPQDATNYPHGMDRLYTNSSKPNSEVLRGESSSTTSEKATPIETEAAMSNEPCLTDAKESNLSEFASASLHVEKVLQPNQKFSKNPGADQLLTCLIYLICLNLPTHFFLNISYANLYRHTLSYTPLEEYAYSFLLSGAMFWLTCTADTLQMSKEHFLKVMEHSPVDVSVQTDELILPEFYSKDKMVLHPASTLPFDLRQKFLTLLQAYGLTGKTLHSCRMDPIPLSKESFEKHTIEELLTLCENASHSAHIQQQLLNLWNDLLLSE